MLTFILYVTCRCKSVIVPTLYVLQKNDSLLKEIEQLKEQYVIKFQEVSAKIDKCKCTASVIYLHFVKH